MALHLAGEGKGEGAVVVAEAQTMGRGRLGRKWCSPKYLNLYLSIILRPKGAARETAWLSLAAAIAIHRTIREVSGLEVELKWPNDVLVNGKKIAGILLEQMVRGKKVDALVLGMGLNLNMGENDFDPEIRPSATSLRIETGFPIDRVVFLQKLLAHLEAWYGEFLQGSLDSIRRHYLDILGVLNQKVRFQKGGDVFHGTVTGLAGDAALRLKLSGGKEISLYSEEITRLRVNEE